MLMLLLRFSISQMDVPTRQSYTMAVVGPKSVPPRPASRVWRGRPARRLSPLFAGLLFSRPSLINVPFFIAGVLKISYDLLLFRAFRALKPPEEVVTPGSRMSFVFPIAPGTTAYHLQNEARRFVMRYLVAWMLGVPFSVIALWYIVGHAACGH